MMVKPAANGRRVALVVPIVLVVLSLTVVQPPHARGGEGVVLVGAGDIGDCSLAGDEKTAHLLHSIPGTVFTAGDNAYPAGSAADFASCYDRSWGSHDWRTRPSPGNHEYETPNAGGYFGYFGSRAGPAGLGYYGYTLGTWRIYSLNSEVLDQAQLDWLREDLAAHPSQRSLAYFHRPLRSSGLHGTYLPVKELWQPLYEAGVEIIVNGHDHDYERFAPMRPDGVRDPTGIREFVVGTGGTALRAFTIIKANSQARQSSVHGVLKLYLADGSYSWRFVSIDGSYGDNGSYRCHGRPEAAS